jgi:sulfatase maturation enzyme AslB (radical SAM superfamily)
MALKTLYLMPTLECNGVCGYCYIPADEKRPLQAATGFRSALKAFLAEAPADAQLRFIGGEPCLALAEVQDLTALFLAVRPAGFVVVNTNGTLLDDDALLPFRQWGGRIVFIVSLDGLAEVHNRRRRLRDGRDAWVAAVDGIRALQRAGITVYCNMVLDQENRAGLDGFFHFLHTGLGMDGVSVSLRSDPAQPLPVETRSVLLIDAYRAARGHGLRVGGHHRLMLGERIPALACRAGDQTLLLAPDRRVYACQRFVGKVLAHRWEPGETLVCHPGRETVVSCCYDETALALGGVLYDFYEQECPEYLAVHPLDHILFGVI